MLAVGGCAALRTCTHARHVLHVGRHGNKYYENMNETLWRHRWVDYASVRAFPAPASSSSERISRTSD